MKTAADKPTTKSPHEDHFSVAKLAADFLDTSWRIAVPVVIFALLGIFVDIKLETKPWLTLLGTVVGFVFAGLLIKKQLATATREDKK